MTDNYPKSNAYYWCLYEWPWNTTETMGCMYKICAS